MKPDKLRVPQVLHHKAKDLDYIQVRDADDRRRPIYLGKHGSAEAARRYREVVAGLLAGKPIATVAKKREAPSGWPNLAQLVLAFLQHAETYYRDADGNRSREIDNFALAFGPLLHLYRDLPTDRIGIRELEAVRQHLIDTEYGHKRDKKTKEIIEGTGKKHCRKYVNACIYRIKHTLRWGVGRKLVPGATWHEVSALRGLSIGRSGARESRQVEAVPRKLVDEVLKHLPAPLVAAVELQWWSGMRPAEVLALRTCDIDRSGKVWTFTPPQHKGTWRGKTRIVKLGPKAQAVLRPLLKADPKAYLISPGDVWAWFKAEKRRRRQTPATKQTRDRDARARTPVERECLDVNTYRRAIHRACDKAKVEHWSPHRLRHAAGTRIYLQAGLEEARVALGHADDSITRRYAVAADSQLAADVMGRLG